MSEKEFQELTIRFDCKNDPTTGTPINHEFTFAEFTEVDEKGSHGLFQLCAMQSGLTEEESVKY